MKQTTVNTEKLLNFVANKFEKEELSNDSLVQLIELGVSYLNLMTISNYAKVNKMSYNGVKKFRNTVELAGVKFVIDND
tara:strand:+ start:856 stop:1092 length:237 start_codon:yes stop_codon:yes gene_type:complete